MLLIKLNPNIHTYSYLYKHVYLYYYQKITSIDHKNDNSDECKWSYCLKEILLVICKFYIICMDIQRVSSSLFLIWRSQDCLIVSISLVLNPIFWNLKTITIQYRDIQKAFDVFIYRFCEDYTNLFWAQMFLLEFLETNLSEFWTFLLPKLASFCDVLKQSCLCLAVLEMLTYYLDM